MTTGFPLAGFVPPPRITAQPLRHDDDSRLPCREGRHIVRLVNDARAEHAKVHLAMRRPTRSRSVQFDRDLRRLDQFEDRLARN